MGHIFVCLFVLLNPPFLHSPAPSCLLSFSPILDLTYHLLINYFSRFWLASSLFRPPDLETKGQFLELSYLFSLGDIYLQVTLWGWWVFIICHYWVRWFFPAESPSCLLLVAIPSYFLLPFPYLVTAYGWVLVVFCFLSRFFSPVFSRIGQLTTNSQLIKTALRARPACPLLTPISIYMSHKMHPWASWHFFLPIVTGPLSSLQDLTVMGHYCTTGRQGWSSSLATYITWGLLIILNIFLENRHLLTCMKETLTLSLLKTCLVLQWFWFSLLFISCIIAMDKS